jgi:hypothetical protein
MQDPRAHAYTAAAQRPCAHADSAAARWGYATLAWNQAPPPPPPPPPPPFPLRVSTIFRGGLMATDKVVALKGV